MKIGKTKKAKKYFRDEYPDYKGGYTPKGNFPGLIHYLRVCINALLSLIALLFRFLISIFSSFAPLISIIILLSILYVVAEIGPKMWKEHKREVAIKELKTKDYLTNRLRRVCYQQLSYSKGKTICLNSQSSLGNNYVWYASFKRYTDNGLSIKVTLSVGTKEKKYPIEFHKIVDGVGVWEARWKLPEPFSCSRGTWSFTQDSIHRKAVPRLALKPKIIIKSNGCPAYLLTFPYWF